MARSQVILTFNAFVVSLQFEDHIVQGVNVTVLDSLGTFQQVIHGSCCSKKVSVILSKYSKYITKHTSVLVKILHIYSLALAVKAGKVAAVANFEQQLTGRGIITSPPHQGGMDKNIVFIPVTHILKTLWSLDFEAYQLK